MVGTDDGVDVVDGEVKVFILDEKGVNFLLGSAYILGSLVMAGIHPDFDFIPIRRGVASLYGKGIAKGRTEPFAYLEAVVVVGKIRHHGPVFPRALL